MTASAVEAFGTSEAYQTAGAGRVPSHVEELASHGKLYGFPTLQALAELPEEDGLVVDSTTTLRLNMYKDP